MVIEGVKSHNAGCLVVVTARHLRDCLKLYALGADYVIYTKTLAENHLGVLLEDLVTDSSSLVEKKLRDLEILKRKA
jgi:hypothetical protein